MWNTPKYMLDYLKEKQKTKESFLDRMIEWQKNPPVGFPIKTNTKRDEENAKNYKDWKINF
jgi:hypothetical protein